jgi:hypothetical protein
MLTEVSPIQAQAINLPQKTEQARTSESRPARSAQTDTVSLSGPTSRKDVATLILNKTLANIQKTGGLESTQNLYNGFSQKDLQNLESLVESAKADLGVSPDTSLDITPEATANRIVDFALLAFSQFQENHDELSEEDVRSEFVEFIGKAIGKGVEEARDTLTGLNSLTEEVDADITTTVNIINERLQQFADQGKTEETTSSQTNDKETAVASLN